MVNSGVCGTLNLGSIPRGGTKTSWRTLKMSDKKKIKPTIGPGFRDLSGDFLYTKKRIIQRDFRINSCPVPAFIRTGLKVGNI